MNKQTNAADGQSENIMPL